MCLFAVLQFTIKQLLHCYYHQLDVFKKKNKNRLLKWEVNIGRDPI